MDKVTLEWKFSHFVIIGIITEMKKKKMMTNIWDSPEMNSFPWPNLFSNPRKKELAFCQTLCFHGGLEINNTVSTMRIRIQSEKAVYCDLTSHFQEK